LRDVIQAHVEQPNNLRRPQETKEFFG
jgi:hypothetical protein